MDSSLLLVHRKGFGVKVNTSQRTLILLAPVVTPRLTLGWAREGTVSGSGSESVVTRAPARQHRVIITDIYSIVTTENGKENSYQKKMRNVEEVILVF